MPSKYLQELSKDEYEALKRKLLNIQGGKCFICGKDIDLDIQRTDIDHVIPLANKGKDKEDNFAITHESCNRSKLDANLKIARILYELDELKEDVYKQGQMASLKHILEKYDGSKHQFIYKNEGKSIKYSFSDIGDNNIYESPIFIDNLSKEEFTFVEVPLEYIYHDELINPRGINSNISKLIKEFYKPNPQLHLSLARFEDNKIKIFDGQHKAVAQILLGTKKLVLRLFLNPNLDRLIETNTNAGSTLKQVAFDKAIMQQLNDVLYKETIEKYKKEKDLAEDDMSFSEQDLINYFRGERNSIKKYIIANLKQSVIKDPHNKLSNYIDFEGKGKKLPISFSTIDKTLFTIFIDSGNILSTPMDEKLEEGLNPRYLERTQLVQFMNIIEEEIYNNKFDMEVGVSQIEDKIVKHRDEDITPEHLTAFRMSKEEIMKNWLLYIKDVIEMYFVNTGKRINKESLFQYKFDDQLWTNIRNFIINLRDMALWKDREMAKTHFSTKQSPYFWEKVFSTGATPDNTPVIPKPINFKEMIEIQECDEE